MHVLNGFIKQEDIFYEISKLKSFGLFFKLSRWWC